MTDQYIPVAGLCAGCDKPIRPNQPYTYREAIVREQVSRSGGVGTKVGRKEYTGRVFCTECGQESPKSGSLF